MGVVESMRGYRHQNTASISPSSCPCLKMAVKFILYIEDLETYVVERGRGNYSCPKEEWAKREATESVTCQFLSSYKVPTLLL